MSDDHNRGAYTPQSDAPLAFDARHSRGPGDRPLPLTLIVSGIILLILVAAGVVFVMRGAGADPAIPVTGQPIDAMKTTEPQVPVQEAKPLEQQGLQIGYSEGQPLPAETTGGPTFTPRPEAPGPRPAPGTPPAPTSTTVVNQPLPPATGPLAITPAAKGPPLAPAPKTETKLAAVAPKPAPKVEARPAAASGSPAVQIGAFSSNALAEQSWNGVANKIPGRIAGKTLRVEKADVDGKTYHRALVGGFTSRADADSFCAALKAEGGACTVRN